MPSTRLLEIEYTPPPPLGERVADARRRAGLSQRALADEIGVSLWEMERLEGGGRDVRRHLAQIAAALGENEASLETAHLGQVPGPGRREKTAYGAGHAAMDGFGKWLVLGSLAILVLIRFFTEVINVIPKAGTFVDVPIFAVLILAATLRPVRNVSGRHHSLFLPGMLFLAVAVISTLANFGRVAPAPVIVFLYGFLAPLCIYYAVYRLWPPGQALSLSRLLVGLGLIQLIVVAAVDLPRFIPTGNPDHISGTFGENAYQLVFFLILLTGMLSAMALFERHRTAAKLAPAFFVAFAIVIFLAQYRALLVTTLLTVLLIGALLSTVRGSAVILTAILVVAFLGSLSLVASRFSTTKFDQTIETFESDPWFFAVTRLRVGDDVLKLYTDDPRFAVVGTGPGTFSSRAWRTFAETQETRTAVAGSYARALNGGEYRTEVSDKYVRPRLRTGATIQGSYAVTQPFSSYIALLAEVGIVGFVFLIGTYVGVTVRAGRLALQAMRDRIPRDPVPALLLASTVAFAVLLQLAALENWLEVTRLTFISWALLAVGTKEIEARRDRGKA